jgi:hypothetical protein
LTAVLLPACSPTFNWRDVAVEPGGLRAMLPCKPEKGSREVPMAGSNVPLEILGCDTGGATFAILHADMKNAARAGEVLWQWRLATVANMRGTAAQDTPFTPAGATPLPQSAQVDAKGTRADGSSVESRAAYFARGSLVFQAVIFSDHLVPEMTEPFFAGLHFE